MIFRKPFFMEFGDQIHISDQLDCFTALSTISSSKNGVWQACISYGTIFMKLWILIHPVKILSLFFRSTETSLDQGLPKITFSENFNSNVNLPTFPNNFTKFHLISLNFHEFFFLNRSSAAEYRICFDFVLILKLRLSVAGSKD